MLSLVVYNEQMPLADDVEDDEDFPNIIKCEAAERLEWTFLLNDIPLAGLVIRRDHHPQEGSQTNKQTMNRQTTTASYFIL